MGSGSPAPDSPSPAGSKAGGRHIGDHSSKKEKEEMELWQSRRKIRFEDEKTPAKQKSGGRRRSGARQLCKRRQFESGRAGGEQYP